ncbi:alpha/beta hydrolase fold domain-containing protein [Phthorimaea operculella]|nr:alpha/beta hydrolase fold domain-containing protein [Phthorimaea operculella]
MAQVLGHVVSFLTIACFLQISSSNIITDGISKVVHAVENVLHLNSSQCFLPEALCNEGILDRVNEIVKNAPNVIEDISKDFLEGQTNKDKDLPITELIAKYGYKLETYRVETEDGYLISVYRIPGNGDPVLLVNGITLSAVDWFTIGKESALPCLLADQGYDVWILNTRGTTEESQEHARFTLPEDAEKYWDFSWDEIGRYDLPAMIDFILQETGKPKIKYIGFSQGTTVFYVMASERPEYGEKISLSVNLGPSAFLPNSRSPAFRLVAAFHQTLENIFNAIGFNKFDATNPLVQFLTDEICGTEELSVIICANIAFSLFGFDYAQVNATQVPVIAAHYPSSFSTKQLIHFGQIIKSGKFRRYDYGDKNMEIYGSELPPDYPLENISTPVSLFYSRARSDWINLYEDVLTLKSKLPNVVDFHEITYKTWAHLDYLWAKDVKELVYNYLLDLLQKY